MSECKHEWCLKSGRGYLYCPLCGKTVPVENYVESLEAKLAAAEKEREQWEDKYKQSCVKRSDEIEKLLELQAAFNALRSAVLTRTRHCETKGGHALACDYCGWGQEICKAASATLPEAYRRVQGLIEALRRAMHLLKIYEKCGHIPSGGEEDGNMLCIIETVLIVKNALERYKGAEAKEETDG